MFVDCEIFTTYFAWALNAGVKSTHLTLWINGNFVYLWQELNDNCWASKKSWASPFLRNNFVLKAISLKLNFMPH